MTSERERENRRRARARLEREMAARAEAARRRRLTQAGIGAGVAGAVVLGAVIWIVIAATGSTPVAAPTPSPTSTSCEWIPDPGAFGTASPTPREGVRDVGTPPTNPPRSGYQLVTITTNLGVIKFEMDLSKTPCTAANIAYLASKKFYDGSSCHRLVPEIFALQCGDPSGTGSGGVTYKVPDENLPVGKLPAYHEGDVAMANTGAPDTNGTQFFFIYGLGTLQGQYSLFGKVIEGMDIIKKVAEGGHDGAFESEAGGGHPKTKLEFTSFTVGPVTEVSQATPTTPAPEPTTASPSATPTASATATPQP